MSQEYVKLFEDLMSGDKDTRTRAESKFQEIKQINLADGLQIFVEGMKCEKPQVAQLAALMLKKTYLDDSEMMKNLKDDQIFLMKQTVKQFLNFEGDWKTLQRLGEVLGKLYSISDLKNSFDDVLNWFKTENLTSQRFANFMIEVMCDIQLLKDDIIKVSVDEFISIFKNGLSHSDVKVRVSSLKATTQFLNNISSNELVMQFTPLTEFILESLIYVLKNDVDIGKTALEAINSLTESHAKFWKQKLEVLIDIICKIVTEKSFSNTVRDLALEIMYSLAKKSPAFVRKSKTFSGQFIPVMFELLLDIDNINDIEEWTKETENDEADKEEMFFGVRDGLSRLGTDLGGKYLVENTNAYIQKFLASSNWIENHAAFVAIGYMSQACRDTFKLSTVEVLNYISNGLVHTHPRVRYAALTALGMLLEEIAPHIQKKFHANIVPALYKLMADNNETNIRVKTHACSALVNFLRGLVSKDSDDEDDIKDIISPYSQELINILATLFEASLNMNYPSLQEETLTCFSLLASILDKDFGPYYSLIMPGLKQVFFNLQPTNESQVNLKVNALETISYLCSSISENSEKYIDELKELCDNLTKILGNVKEEDPLVPALFNAFSHISTSMKEQFYPYFEMISPILEKYVNADIGFKMEDAALTEYVGEDANPNEDNKISLILNFSSTNNQKLTLNSYALQNKVMAVEVLHDIAQNMARSFKPYLERFLVLMKSLLKCPYSSKIRKIAIKSFYSAVLICQDENERKKVLEFYGTEVNSIFAYNIESKFLREVKAYLKVLINTFEEIKAPTSFSQEFIVNLLVNLENSVKFIEEHKAKLKTMVKNDEGLDENDEEILESDLDILNEANRRVMELSGILFKLFRENIAFLINKHLYPLFLSMWQNALLTTKNDQEICTCVCFFDDYMNYSGLTDFKNFYPTFFDMTVTNYRTTNEDILQSIIFGLGVIAYRLPSDEFQKIADKILGPIITVISRNVTDDNCYTYDNAISALGKYVISHCQTDQKGLEMISQFLSLLPLKNDLDESEDITKLLLQQIANQHPLLVNDVTSPKLKEALVRTNEFRKSEEEFFINDKEALTYFTQVCNSLGIN
jgi:hypothetical protein